MIEAMIEEFMGSGAGAQATQALQQQGLTPEQAHGALGATVHGAADAMTGGGGAQALAGLLSGGGGAAALAGLLGDRGGSAGGIGDALGALTGGGAGGLGGVLGALTSGGGAGGLPPALVQTIAGLVSQRAGLSPQVATAAVTAVLPHVLGFLHGRAGGGGVPGGGGGGLLGGLLG